MKILFFILTMTSTLANPNLNRFDCLSKDSLLTIKAVKSPCIDERYKVWQKNGCYQITVTNNEISETIEMVRNLSYELEERSNSYAFYTYDKKEWILDGLIVEMTAEDGRPAPRMRFDTRENAKRPFVSTYGFCLLSP